MQILYQWKKCQIKNTLHAKVREATFRHLLNGVSRIPVFCKSTFATFCTDFSDVGNVTLKTCQKFAYCTFKFGAYSLNSFKQDNIDPDQSKIKSIALRLHKIKKDHKLQLFFHQFLSHYPLLLYFGLMNLSLPKVSFLPKQCTKNSRLCQWSTYDISKQQTFTHSVTLCPENTMSYFGGNPH